MHNNIVIIIIMNVTNDLKKLIQLCIINDYNYTTVTVMGMHVLYIQDNKLATIIIEFN